MLRLSGRLHDLLLQRSPAKRGTNGCLHVGAPTRPAGGARGRGWAAGAMEDSPHDIATDSYAGRDLVDWVRSDDRVIGSGWPRSGSLRLGRDLGKTGFAASTNSSSEHEHGAQVSDPARRRT